MLHVANEGNTPNLGHCQGIQEENSSPAPKVVIYQMLSVMESYPRRTVDCSPLCPPAFYYLLLWQLQTSFCS